MAVSNRPLLFFYSLFFAMEIKHLAGRIKTLAHEKTRTRTKGGFRQNNHVADRDKDQIFYRIPTVRKDEA